MGHARSQYQARRLLELVCNNSVEPARAEYVDRDRWARVSPPLTGRRFSSRESAKRRLRRGELGAAVPMLTVHNGAGAGAEEHADGFKPEGKSVGSGDASKVSSVLSFGKPVDAVGEAALQHGGEHWDVVEEPFLEEESSSRLFREIGPSISMLHNKTEDGSPVTEAWEEAARYEQWERRQHVAE